MMTHLGAKAWLMLVLADRAEALLSAMYVLFVQGVGYERWGGRVRRQVRCE